MKITIKVVPKAHSQRLILDKNGVLKCYITSPPEDGKANKEVIKFLANLLKTTQRDIQIIHGMTSRTKIVEISGFDTYEKLIRALGLQVQTTLFS